MAINKYLQNSLRSQHGTALLASLLLLLVITIISVTAMKDTMMDENMARNDQNHTIAFQAADASINKTLTLLRKDEVLADEAKTALDNGNTNPPTRNFPEINLGSSPKDVENNVVVAQTLYGNPRGSCANYDCPFNARRFNLTASAEVVNTNASATLLQNAQKEPYLRNPDRTFTTPQP
jgi:type II secretory pathway component PulK